MNMNQQHDDGAGVRDMHDAIKEQIVRVAADNPGWDARAIAKAVGTTPAYIAAILRDAA